MRNGRCLAIQLLLFFEAKRIFIICFAAHDPYLARMCTFGFGNLELAICRIDLLLFKMCSHQTSAFVPVGNSPLVLNLFCPSTDSPLSDL